MSDDDLNILLRSNEQISDIMRNKNKFVVTRLNNQHVYSMRKNFVEKKKNSKSQEKMLHLQQQKNNRLAQPSDLRSLQLLKSLNSENISQPILNRRQSNQNDYLNYALQLGTPSSLYTSSLTIQSMLENAGHDVNTKNQQVKVENSYQNSLKKRTFYNCNRGMGLFEPKINEFNPRSEIHRIKLRTNDPLALLLHYTVNQSISTEPIKNNPPQNAAASPTQFNSLNSSIVNQQNKKKVISEKDSLKFLDGVLRQGYVQGLSKAVFQNDTILQDHQIEKTFMIENPIYNEYLHAKRDSISHSKIHLPKIQTNYPNNMNLHIKSKDDSHFFGKEDESFFQKINLKKQHHRKSLHLEEFQEAV